MKNPSTKFVIRVLTVMDYLAGVDSGTGLTDGETANAINQAILSDVARDVWETADREFSDDDVRLAIGRVLRKRLGIEEV